MNKFTSALICLSVGAAILATTYVIDRGSAQRHEQLATDELRKDLALLAGRLEQSINHQLQLTRGLAAFVQSRPNFSEQDFDRFANALVGDQRGIRSLQLAPNAVVRYITNKQVNAKAIGHDLLGDPRRRPLVQQAIDNREYVIAGPINLIQGGKAVIARLPIFLPLDHGSDYFWGLATILIDPDILIGEAGIVTGLPNAELAIRGKDAKGVAGDTFYGEQAVFDEGNVEVPITLPSGSWVLGAKFTEPSFVHTSVNQLPIRIGGAVIALIASLSMFSLLRRPEALRVAVNEAIAETQESRRRFSDFAEASSDWFWEADKDLRYSYFSPRFEDVTGVNPEEILGKTRAEVPVPGVPEDEWNAHLETLESHKPFRNFIHQRTRKDGEMVWLSINGRPLHDEHGNFLGYRGSGRDITAEKRTELDLEAAKLEAESANHAKSEFLATMSHEIRTPMTGVIGFANILLTEDIPEESKNHAQRIKAAAESLLRIINDILDVSKLEAGKVDIERLDFNIHGLLRDVVSMFEGSGNAKLKCNLELADDFPEHIHSDPTRLRQILINLVGNAVKFTHEGSVTVRGELLSTSTGPDMLRFLVVDTGIGMSGETLTKLFTNFTQADASVSRNYEGTGLGLAICARLAELMDGDINVKSELGKGSTFWFTVPYVAASEQTSDIGLRDRDNVDYSKDMRPLKILVAEDNQINQIIISKTLESFGHRFVIVENGKEAIQEHGGYDFDLILMDVRMPEMSGPEATRIIRQLPGEKGKIPIIALTADAMDDHRKEYLDAGMNDVVTKPIDHAELARALSEVTS